jgi:hypothetical protein
VNVGASYAFNPSASDPDGDRLRFSISNLPAWAQFSRKTGRLSGSPSASHTGTTRNVTISVTDGPSTTSMSPFDIQVTTAATEPDPTDPIEDNEPPTLSGTPPTEVAVGERYDFTPRASDPDGDPLSFSVSNRPAWMSFDSGSGRLTGTPADGDVGEYTNILIKVSDGEATDSLSAFDVQVSGTGGFAVSLSWTPPTEREDGTALNGLAGYRIHLGRDRSSLDQVIDVPNGGLASYTIEALSSGTWYFAVQAYDKAGLRSKLSAIATTIVD